jgi:hypothetical protein
MPLVPPTRSRSAGVSVPSDLALVAGAGSARFERLAGAKWLASPDASASSLIRGLGMSPTIIAIAMRHVRITVVAAMTTIGCVRKLVSDMMFSFPTGTDQAVSCGVPGGYRLLQPELVH